MRHHHHFHETIIAAIRTRAYEIWENEGRPDGHSVDHWLQAETESIRMRMKMATSRDDFASLGFRPWVGWPPSTHLMAGQGAADWTPQ